MRALLRGILVAILALPLLVNASQTASAAYTGTVSGSVSESGTLTLSAPGNAIFTEVVFASYGTPGGSAGSYTVGSCHSNSSITQVGNVFLNQNSGSISANNTTFGDPCSGTGKSLAVTMGYTYPPANTVLPAISGTYSVGQVLSATSGTWNYSPTGFSYQWFRATTSGGTYTAISGANTNAYTIVSADVAYFFKVTVTASNAAGGYTATSPATVSAVSGVTTTTLSITGNPTTTYFRTVRPIIIGVSFDGRVTVRANGVIIPGCKNKLTTSLSFTCNWKPANHKQTSLVATYTPTVAGYLASTSTTYRIQVIERVNNR